MTDDQLFGETDFEEENRKLRRENKQLNAFLVSKDLAIEYIRWRKGRGDD